MLLHRTLLVGVCAAALLLGARTSQADVFNWNNTGGDRLWSNAANWNVGAGFPGGGDTVNFQGTGIGNVGLGAGGQSAAVINLQNTTGSYVIGAPAGGGLFINAGLSQSGAGTNTIASQLSAFALSGSISAGSLSLTNTTNNFVGSLDVSGGNLVITASGANSGLGGASVNLAGGNLTVNGTATSVSGLAGRYWNVNNNGNNFDNNFANLNTYLNGLGTPNVSQVLPVTGPGTINGWAGGINLTNNGYGTGNAFAPLGFDLGNVNSTTDWRGTMHVNTAGTYTFRTNSDDASLIYVDGVLKVDYNGGHGAGGPITNNAVTLAAGDYQIVNAFNQGNGGWGILSEYANNATGTFTPLGKDSADITFLTTVNSSFNLGNPISTQTGTSSTFTANSTTSTAVGMSTLTLNAGSTLAINGTAAGLNLPNTVINNNATINNSIPVTAGPISGTVVGLTKTGAGNLFLDSTAAASGFGAGATINANGGTVVGVHNGVNNSLGSATLNVNGGNFNLGSNADVNFANPITGSNNGTITAGTLGSGATDTHTITLTGGASLTGGTVTLATKNGYAINLGSAVTGSGSLATNGSVRLNTANPAFNGSFSVNGGTTDDNITGALATASSVNVNNGSTLNVQGTSPNETLKNLTINNNSSVNLGGTNPTLSGTTAINGNDANNRGQLNVNNAPTGAPTINVNNNGLLNINTAAAVNLSGTTVNSGGTLQLNSNQAAASATPPTAAIAGNLNLNSDISAGYNLSTNGSTIQAIGAGRNFASNLTLGGTNTVGAQDQNLTTSGTVGGSGGITKVGAGTLTLAGSNSYSGTTNVNAGTLTLQTAATGGGAFNVNAGGTLNAATAGIGASALNVAAGTAKVTGNVNLSNASASINSGGLVQFDAPNTSFSGSTMNFDNGTINAHSGNANLSGTNLVAVPFQTGPGTNNLNAVQYASGSATFNNYDPTNNGAPNTPDVVTNHYILGDVSAPNATTRLNAANPGNPNLPAQRGINFPQDSDGGFKGFFGSNFDDFTVSFFGRFTAPTAGAYRFGISLNDDGTSVIVDPANGPKFATSGYQYASIGCCNLDTGANITLAAGQTVLVAYNVRDTGGGSGIVGNVTIPGNATPFFVDPSSPAQAGWWQTLNPITSGGGTANIDASSTLQANSFTSFTNINLAGGATAGSAATLQTFGSTVSDTTNLTVSGTTPFANLAIGGTGSVKVQNLSVPAGGLLTVSGTGTLVVDGTGGTGAGTVKLTGSAKLGGHGTITGPVQLGAGTILAPGNSIGTLTVNSLVLDPNSILNYELSTPNVVGGTANDLTSVLGALSLGGTVNVSAQPGFGAGTYRLFNYTGALTGNAGSLHIGAAPGGYNYGFTTPGNGTVNLLVSAVPEPGSMILLAMGMAGLFVCARRKRA